MRDVWARLLAYVTGTVNQELLLHVPSASTACPDRLMNINFIRGIITLSLLPPDPRAQIDAGGP